MVLEPRLVTAAVVADRAGGRVDSSAAEYGVDVEAAGLAEPLPTVPAAEGPALGVGVLVVPQVVLPPEGLATNITGKGPLIRVSPLMDEKVVGLGELPVAKLADEPLLRLCNR